MSARACSAPMPRRAAIAAVSWPGDRAGQPLGGLPGRPGEPALGHHVGRGLVLPPLAHLVVHAELVHGRAQEHLLDRDAGQPQVAGGLQVRSGRTRWPGSRAGCRPRSRRTSPPRPRSACRPAPNSVTASRSSCRPAEPDPAPADLGPPARGPGRRRGPGAGRRPPRPAGPGAWSSARTPDRRAGPRRAPRSGPAPGSAGTSAAREGVRSCRSGQPSPGMSVRVASGMRPAYGGRPSGRGQAVLSSPP